MLLGQDTLEPGATAFARIRLEKPAFALPGDRFIVRQYSPMTTLGGGEILDAHPPRLRRSDPTLVKRLADPGRRDSRREDPQAGGGGGRRQRWIKPRSLPVWVSHRQPRGTELKRLAQEGGVRVLDPQLLVVADAEVFERAASRATEEVRRFHAAEPLLPGIGREDLKTRVFANASPVFFRAVLDESGRRKRSWRSTRTSCVPSADRSRSPERMKRRASC